MGDRQLEKEGFVVFGDSCIDTSEAIKESVGTDQPIRHGKDTWKRKESLRRVGGWDLVWLGRSLYALDYWSFELVLRSRCGNPKGAEDRHLSSDSSTTSSPSSRSTCRIGIPPPKKSLSSQAVLNQFWDSLLSGWLHFGQYSYES